MICELRYFHDTIHAVIIQFLNVLMQSFRHRYDDIIMGFYDKAFDNSLQAKAAGSKPILFPANQNLGRSGLYHS